MKTRSGNLVGPIMDAVSSIFPNNFYYLIVFRIDMEINRAIPPAVKSASGSLKTTLNNVLNNDLQEILSQSRWK